MLIELLIYWFIIWLNCDWWISLEMIELCVIVEMCWFGNESDNVIVMWIVIEKWWVESEFDELFEIDWLVDNLIELCLLLRMMWNWDTMRWEMRWGLRCWWWKIELSYWDCGFENCWIEIELMKFVNLFELMNYVNCMCLMVMSWLF